MGTEIVRASCKHGDNTCVCSHFSYFSIFLISEFLMSEIRAIKEKGRGVWSGEKNEAISAGKGRIVVMWSAD